MHIHCTLSHTEPYRLPLNPTDPHWAPPSPTDPHRAPLSPTDPHWTPLNLKYSRWAHPTDPSNLYSASLTPTESHWAQCSLHLPPLTYIHPSVTHNDSFLSQGNPIWPKITLNNIGLSPNCLKRPQPTIYVNYDQCMQLFCLKRQPIMHYDPKSHLTSIYSSII